MSQTDCHSDLVLEVVTGEPFDITLPESADESLTLFPQLASPPGPKGEPGSETPISAVAGEALPALAPAAADRVNGTAVLADRSVYAKSYVLGLVAVATATGFVAQLMRGPVTADDWSAVTGEAQLRPGLPYYLGDAPGTLTHVPPEAGSLAQVGVAATPNTLSVAPSVPILL